MTKINCVIVDDEVVAREILESFVVKTTNLNLLKSCKNAMEAIDVINTENVDLMFLDINMPEISGLSLAKSISSKTKIIFTTAYREYAIDGFDLQAVDYLLKPIAFDRFLLSVNKFFETNSKFNSPIFIEDKQEKNDFIFVRSERKMVKISFNDIRYVESLSDYIKIYLNDKKVITRETISNIEAKLPPNQFFRVHRSYIVSKDKIDSYTSEFIEIDKKALPISRTYKDDVMKNLEAF